MAYNTHDNAVMHRINRHIRMVNKDHPKLTVAEKLEMAWSNNIREREEDPSNTIGRDADYYFAARHELAKSDNPAVRVGKGIIGEAGWTVYSTLKIVLDAVDLGKMMRTDKDKPNAPVGGFFWMNRGIADAMKLDLSQKVMPVKQHFWLVGNGQLSADTKTNIG